MPSNQEQATSLLSQIPLAAIVGAPLKAAIDAQAAAAVACYDFITNIGFENPPAKDGEPKSATTGLPIVANKGTVRDVTFSFERKESDTKVNTISITVPLLTILPIPFIRIESMTVSFKASISAEDTHQDQASASSGKEAEIGGSLGLAWWKVNASAKVSSKKDSTATSTSKYSVEHTMDISVHAVQEDMPAGLAKILAIMTDSIKMDVRPAGG